jgi:hypothetical protein
MSGIMNKLHLKGNQNQNQQGSLYNSGGLSNSSGYATTSQGIYSQGISSAEANPISERTVVGYVVHTI